MRALTLLQPWAHAVCALGKRVENRTWQPPATCVGQRLAIHAGKAWGPTERAVVTSLVERGHSVPDDLPLGAVVAIATIAGTLTAPLTPEEQEELGAWWLGPIGWVLRDVHALQEPVPCRGNQGLWRLPLDVLRAVEAQVPSVAAVSPTATCDRCHRPADTLPTCTTCRGEMRGYARAMRRARREAGLCAACARPSAQYRCARCKPPPVSSR